MRFEYVCFLKVKEEKERLKADVAELRTLSNKLQQDIGQVNLHPTSSEKITTNNKSSIRSSSRSDKFDHTANLMDAKNIQILFDA